MALSDTAIKKLKPRDKAYKKADERGLYLLITPNGSKLWKFKYRYEGKEKKLSFGSYEDVSLAKARDKRKAARELLAAGIDPSDHHKAILASQSDRAANSFEVIGREWFDRFSPSWSKGHCDRVKRQLEKDLYPWIGGLAISDIDAPTLLSCLRRIEKRGAIISSHRTRGVAGQVFRYAIATGRAVREKRLLVGDCGTIVMVYSQGAGYEVEFCQFNEGGGLLLTLYPHEIEPCKERGHDKVPV